MYKDGEVLANFISESKPYAAQCYEHLVIRSGDERIATADFSKTDVDDSYAKMRQPMEPSAPE